MFCPVCLTTAALIAGSATGAGGVTTLAVTKILRRKPDGKTPPNPTKEEN